MRPAGMSNSIVPLMAAVDGYVLAPSVNAKCPLAAKLNVSLPIWLSSAIARPAKLDGGYRERFPFERIFLNRLALHRACGVNPLLPGCR